MLLKLLTHRIDYSILHLISSTFETCVIISAFAPLLYISDINPKNSNGATPLLIAAELGHIAAVRLLTESNATLDDQIRNGYTAFLFAIRNGHLSIVQHLLSVGADPGSIF